MFSISIHNRDYSSWEIEPHDPFQKKSPITFKLFDGDVFNVKSEVEFIDSPVRQNQNIPGILILEKNRSYGRTENKKRLLYRCKPFNTRYPHFLIPYEIPMGFNKNFRNKYVTFRFDHWSDKHPRGILSQNIGDVDDLPSYYEYQLFCRKLHTPITQALKQCKIKSAEKSHEEWIQYIMDSSQIFGDVSRDNTNNIIAIDPEDCTDRDDAIAVRKLSENTYKVTVYIANIWVWIEAFDLWSAIGNRISTIYLPDRKRSMLPTLIAEEYSSLDAGKECFALTMDIIVENGFITKCEDPLQKLIKVHKHFHYDDPKLFKNKNYQLLETVTKMLDKSISDSHDVVAFWMMKMNTTMAYKMRQKEIGIYRVVQSKNQNQPTASLPSSLKQFVRMWEQKMAGKYEIFNKGTDLSHTMLELKEYVHFTSPIRRMVDLINHLSWLQSEYTISNTATQFVEDFEFNMTQVNAKMSDIKKVQNDCNILYQVTNEPELLDKIYDAVVLTKHDELIYSVYIEELKWITKIYSIEPFDLYSITKCKIYVFIKEEQLRKKIRVQVI